MATTEPNAFAKVVAQSWSDKEFRQRLKDDPHAALAEHGIDVPSGTNLNVMENTSDTVHIVIPAEPDGEISEDDLAKVSGGTVCTNSIMSVQSVASAMSTPSA
jgi:Nitrile hydratase, alpha chain